MRQERSSRGSALLTVLIILTMLLVFSAALTVISVVGLQAMTESERAIRAYYLADSGVQIGIARARANGLKQAKETFTETIDQGTAAGDIDPTTDPLLYKITGTGTFEGMQTTVEGHLKFTPAYGLTAAVALTFSTGTSISGGPSGLPVQLDSVGKISGKDHNASGAELADQSKAVYGLTTNPVSGNLNFAISGPGIAEGVPQAFTNTTASRQSMLTGLVSDLQTNAQVQVSGTTVTWDNAQTGQYGTAASPKTVFVDLAANDGKLIMKNNFSGYGTLVIDVDYKQIGESGSLLEMQNNAEWTGIIILRFTGTEADFEGTSEPALKLQNNARIIGGTEIFFANSNVETTSESRFVGLKDNAEVLYSSSVVARAPGTSSVGTPTAELVSYRRL